MNNKSFPLISIIVPIYKVELYMDECIESIVNQTYKKIEIILVDDGSPDNCPKKCDEWAKRDSRIRVIHKKNGGLSDARNIGIKNANGNYITFVDGDDIINRKMIEILYNNMIDEDADVSVCQFYNFIHKKDQINAKEEIRNNEVCVFFGNEKFNNLYNEKFINTTAAWAKIYKKKIFDNIKFPNGKLHEDVWIAHYILDAAQKIIYTSAKLYYYRHREFSITATFSEKRLDELNAYKDRMLFFHNNYPNSKYEELSTNVYVDQIINQYCLFRYNNQNSKYREIIKSIKKEYNIHFVEFFKKTKRIERKIKYVLFYFLPSCIYTINVRKYINSRCL